MRLSCRRTQTLSLCFWVLLRISYSPFSSEMNYFIRIAFSIGQLFSISKLLTDGECSHEMKMLTPWEASYNQPRQHIKKQRHYFAKKVCLVKAMVFPVVMYGCESWTVKKAEHRRINAFEPWYWRRLFRVPWTARRSNQSILKEISPGISLEGMMLKLKLQYFGHLM